MANALYDKGREAFLLGDIDWVADNIKVVLIDLADYGVAISDATNASPIVITANSHGLSNGDRAMITAVGGNTAANGIWTVANAAANTFELSGSTGNGAYTSGGFVVKIGTHDFLDDVLAAARVATSANLASKTATAGVADAANVTFSAVTGDPSEALVIYKDSGVEATSPLIAYIDTATGLPVTPNGGDITVTWDDGANKIFKL